MTAKKTSSRRTAAGKAPTRPATKKPPTKAEAGARPFTPKVQRFIDEYLIDMNGSAAYKRAGYAAKGNSAEVNARRLLRNAQVMLEIARRRDATAAKLEISREEALQEAWNIVKADANDLIEYRRFACLKCYPDAHDYDQRDPTPGCDGCNGDGVPNVLVKDTRRLNPQARALYAGVKITKEGIEIKMHSKLDALEKVFKHLGLYEADKRKVEITGANGGPIETKSVRAMSDAELLAVIQAANK